MNVRRWDRFRLVGGAVAGAALGHTLVYLVAVPDTQARATVLAETGHSNWSLAVAAAMVLGALAAATTTTHHFLRGWQRQRVPAMAVGDQLAPLAGRLSVLQVGIYLVQEALERLASGSPVDGLLHHQLLLVGVAVQALVAVGVAGVLLLLGHVAEVAGLALRRLASRARDTVAAFSPTLLACASRLLAGSVAIRAPPACAARTLPPRCLPASR